MATRSVNKILLIGNLTKDPELKYTAQGTAVVNMTIATNRSWKNAQGEVQDEATFHRVVAWQKLAEICNQLLFKGRKVYIEGRLATRSWDDEQGNRKYMTEIVANEVILLDSKRKEEVKQTQTEQIVGTPPEPEKEVI